MQTTLELKVKPHTYSYSCGLRWTAARKGILTVRGKPDLEIATPPEFNGHEGIWSPEDLLVAAVNACTMMTFLALANSKGLALRSYESAATGTLERADGSFRFTKIVVRPRIVPLRTEEVDKAREACEEAEASCFLTNSLLADVQSEPDVTVQR